MLRLCGFAASSYYNKVKIVLLEKGIAFAEELVFPTGEAALLADSPMGNVPYLKTDRGALAESQVIVDYLEEICPDPPPYPSDPYDRARVRELITLLELHLELVVRRLYPEAFFGGRVGDAVKSEVDSLLRQGLAALGRRTRFAGHRPAATRGIYGADMLFETFPEARDCLKRLTVRPTIAKMNDDRKARLDAFIAFRRARLSHRPLNVWCNATNLQVHD